MAAQVIAVVHEKGGIGKTTFALDFSGALAAQGERVLLLDLDTQASLTRTIFGSRETDKWPVQYSVVALFSQLYETDPAALIRPVAFSENVAIVPGNAGLKEFNVPNFLDMKMQQLAVRDFVNEVRSQWDYVVIDCPSNLQMTTWTGVVAADAVIVPLQPAKLAVEGIPAVNDFWNLARCRWSPELRHLGYLLVKVQRNSTHRNYEGVLRSQYGPEVFTTVIPESAIHLESTTAQMPVAQYKPRSAGAKVVLRATTELLGRLNRVQEVAQAG